MIILPQKIKIPNKLSPLSAPPLPPVRGEDNKTPQYNHYFPKNMLRTNKTEPKPGSSLKKVALQPQILWSSLKSKSVH